MTSTHDARNTRHTDRSHPTERSRSHAHRGAEAARTRGRHRVAAASVGALALAAGLSLAFAGNALASAPTPVQALALGSAVTGSIAPNLNTKVAPGGNFNLAVWSLQLPIGSSGNPTIIAPSQLEGDNGFQDSYFYTNKTDGGMEFWDPEKGVTTPNSSYPRSELREMDANGQDANWFPTGTTNTLSASLKILKVPDHVCVGQIHLGSGGSTKPLLELFYYADGEIQIGIEQTPAGGNEILYPVGKVALGTEWSYRIGLSNSTISLAINGAAAKTWQMSSTFKGYGMYFKAGDYDQTAGSSTTLGAEVEFYALTVAHS